MPGLPLSLSVHGAAPPSDAFTREALRRGLLAFLDASILSAPPGRRPARDYARALDGGKI
jgi:hypothetical protein